MLTTSQLLERIRHEGGFTLSPQSLSDLAKRGLIDAPVRRRVQTGGRGSQGYWDPSTVEQLLRISKLREAGKAYDEIAQELAPGQPRKAVRLNLSVWLLPEHADHLKAVSRSTGHTMTALLQEGARLYAEATPEVRVALDQSVELLTLLDAENPAARGTMLMIGHWANLAAQYYELIEAIKAGEVPRLLIDPSHEGQIGRYVLRVAIRDGKLTVQEIQALPEMLSKEDGDA